MPDRKSLEFIGSHARLLEAIDGQSGWAMVRVLAGDLAAALGVPVEIRGEHTLIVVPAIPISYDI